MQIENNAINIHQSTRKIRTSTKATIYKRKSIMQNLLCTTIFLIYNIFRVHHVQSKQTNIIHQNTTKASNKQAQVSAAVSLLHQEMRAGPALGIKPK